ncbi:MAG: suppressor of fused domain protein [Ruminococcus sp.]|nr:suppressor of fused domain protein [Ruminococcus sp.]
MNGEEVVMDGWNAITDAFEKVYPGQDAPEHYGVLIPWQLGGSDPLDGISIYDGGDCWHFVSFGLSELYEKECDDPEVSGWGMEFTLRLKKGCYEDEAAELRCICGIFQSIARLTFENGEVFDTWEWIYTGQQTGMDARQLSGLTGFITIPDTKVPPIDTPNGKLKFVEFIGATDAELRRIQSKELTVKELYEQLGTDVTDYSRGSLY